MFKKCLYLTGSLFILLLSTATIQAATQPVQLSLLAPIQIFSEADSIEGVRLTLLYGKNKSVKGLDWAFLVNHTTSGSSLGLQMAPANFNNVSYHGLQMGFFNYTKSMTGVQFGIINYTHRLNGIQIGILNFIEKGGAFPLFPIVNWAL